MPRTSAFSREANLVKAIRFLTSRSAAKASARRVCYTGVMAAYGDTLSLEDGKQIVNDMLLICQKLKSNFAETMNWAGFKEEEVNLYCEEELDWLTGDKDIVPLLIDLSMGLKPIDGLGIMNLMHISHRSMNGIIAAIAPLRLPDHRDLPEPNMLWATLGELK